MCDSPTSGTAVPTVFIDNERTRVTEWRFAEKGSDTGWHRHEYDYVVVPMGDGILEIDLPDGERVTAELKTGVPYFRELGVEHNVINGNDFEFAFVEIEFLK
ncbi:MAG: cupin domain-containing protein [Proteobacteria bacterium]|nr:cupin domain-containing protein [Pseudomonadota bacterium]